MFTEERTEPIVLFVKTSIQQRAMQADMGMHLQSWEETGLYKRWFEVAQFWCDIPGHAEVRVLHKAVA